MVGLKEAVLEMSPELGSEDMLGGKVREKCFRQTNHKHEGGHATRGTAVTSLCKNLLTVSEAWEQEDSVLSKKAMHYTDLNTHALNK